MRAAAWPFVGRELELERIGASISDPDCLGLILTGAAGVGKTRLAREALAIAESHGNPTEWVTGLRVSVAIPLGPFAHLIPVLEGDGSDLLFVLRQLSQGLTERARAEGRRLILGVDDAHQLDDASATLVHHLATNAGAFVLASLRAGETPPGPIVALAADSRIERLDVRLLRRGEVETLVPAALGGPVAGATLHELWRTSGGNALWLRELVLAAWTPAPSSTSEACGGRCDRSPTTLGWARSSRRASPA
jgi:hypothetical protein